MKLPPKPDPVTGLPRPPAVFGDDGGKHESSWTTDRNSKPPDPPPGMGPALEWSKISGKEIYGGAGVWAVIGLGLLTLMHEGFGWLSSWVNWSIVLALPVFSALCTVLTYKRLSAGADWLCCGRKWVKIYELAEVDLGSPETKMELVLKDTSGRKVSLSLKAIEENCKLWDLTLNGILHSAHYGGAAVNGHARRWLWLDILYMLYSDKSE